MDTKDGQKLSFLSDPEFETGQRDVSKTPSTRTWSSRYRLPAWEHSVIEVRNLSTNALVGSDIWGGQGNRYQPILLTARLSLQDSFDSAAQTDKLNDSTVNYSTLSKAILKSVSIRDTPFKDSVTTPEWNLHKILNHVLRSLMTKSTDGRELEPVPESSFKRAAPLIKSIDLLRELQLTVFLPKATLLSSGVSLALYLEHSGSTGISLSHVLKIHGLRTSTLIGLNANERLAKQIVIASVEIDDYKPFRADSYNQLEQVIVKSLEESSFETLESLAVYLANRVIKHYIYPLQFALDGEELIHSRVKISLEKPSATTFADAPFVEVTRSSDPQDPVAGRLYQEWQQSSKTKCPFPMSGRLDEWIAINYPGDTTAN